MTVPPTGITVTAVYESHSLTQTDAKAPTCTEAGWEAYGVCECGYSTYKEIPATGHTPDTEWHSDSENHWHMCAVCSSETDKAAHDFVWETDKEATATEAGSKHEECSVCGYEKAAVEIPATGTTTDPSDDTTTDGSQTDSDIITPPQTGDSSNIAHWIAVMLTAGATITGTALYNRKKKYEK